jgi:ABC-type transport system involved in multi-copper enzyme maturation permease subunit
VRGVTRDCIVELFDRKVIWLYALITLVMVATIIIVGHTRVYEDPDSLRGMGSLTFKEFRAEVLVVIFEWFVYVFVVLTVLITAGKVPVMLVPGRVEFFLSKPLSRTSLYLNKLLGMLITYGGLIVVCGLVGYAAINTVGSYWSASIVYIFVLNLVSLFVWLSITTFGGIAFGSTSMAFVTAAVFWFAQLALRGREVVKRVVDSAALDTVFDVLYYIVPKTGELSDLTADVALGKPVTSWLPLYSSLVFAFVLIAAAAVIFNRKNY